MNKQVLFLVLFVATNGLAIGGGAGCDCGGTITIVDGSYEPKPQEEPRVEPRTEAPHQEDTEEPVAEDGGEVSREKAPEPLPEPEPQPEEPAQEPQPEPLPPSQCSELPPDPCDITQWKWRCDVAAPGRCEVECFGKNTGPHRPVQNDHWLTDAQGHIYGACNGILRHPNASYDGAQDYPGDTTRVVAWMCHEHPCLERKKTGSTLETASPPTNKYWETNPGTDGTMLTKGTTNSETENTLWVLDIGCLQRLCPTKNFQAAQ